MNSTATPASTFGRPILSEMRPAVSAPIMHPTSMELAAIDCSRASRENSWVIWGSADAMMPGSYPKSTPPGAATNATHPIERWRDGVVLIDVRVTALGDRAAKARRRDRDLLFIVSCLL